MDTTLSLSMAEQVRHVISMTHRERDNVSQKLIWYQMGRMVTLVTEYSWAALCISLRGRPGQHEDMLVR
jgi:hypothetical protein